MSASASPKPQFGDGICSFADKWLWTEGAGIVKCHQFTFAGLYRRTETKHCRYNFARTNLSYGQIKKTR